MYRVTNQSQIYRVTHTLNENTWGHTSPKDIYKCTGGGIPVPRVPSKISVPNVQGDIPVPNLQGDTNTQCIYRGTYQSQRYIQWE